MSMNYARFVRPEEFFGNPDVRAGRGAGRCSKPSKLVLHPSAMWIKVLGKSKLMILSNVPVDQSSCSPLSQIYCTGISFLDTDSPC
jgi:hypothetical protein